MRKTRFSSAAVALIAVMLTAVQYVGAADSPSDLDPRPEPIHRSRGPSLSFSPREEYSPNGNISIELETPGGWQSLGEMEFDKHLRQRETVVQVPEEAEQLRVRISRSGGGASHLDSILLDGRAPMNLDARLTRKLSTRDNDVVDTEEVAALELVFPIAAARGAKDTGGAAMTLELAGRIEGERISETPFQFPVANTYKEITPESEFYNYQIGSNPNRMTVDGSILEVAGRRPFFSANPPVGSGHPQAPTSGWVTDDGENLYVAIDFAGDNTMDGGKDYAAVHVRTPAGVKTFRVSTREPEWGTPGFEYTDTVGWEHKVYEFAIPFVALGLDANAGAEGRALELGFEAYGTLSPPRVYLIPDANGIDPDSGPRGTDFTFIVTYQDTSASEPKESRVWVDLDGDTQIDSAAAAALLGGAFRPLQFFVVLGFFTVSFLVALKGGKTAVAGVGAFIVVAAIIGCTGAGASGSTQDELFEMTMVNPPFDLSQEEYSATVTIDAPPGTYHVEFRFKDGGDPPDPVTDFRDSSDNPISNSFELTID